MVQQILVAEEVELVTVQEEQALLVLILEGAVQEL
jgi:hypothetical protein